jgi:uncharacterized protein (TIGR02145 family)
MRAATSLFFCLACLFSVASAQVHNGLPSSARMADGKEWTTRNLEVSIDQSWCFADAEQNCRRYGRLYTWESAKHSCESLRDRWRLPAEDEWRHLAKRYRGVSIDSKDAGRAAYKALLASGFNAVLGGNRTDAGKFERLEAHGFYWTATETGRHTAWFYNFGQGNTGLYRQTGGSKQMGLSVRCIRN